MSYRGHRKHWSQGRGQVPTETPEESIKKSIFEFGTQAEFDPKVEPVQLARLVHECGEPLLHIVADAIRLSIIEMPHKISHLASLVALLYNPSSSDATEPDPFGLHILQVCWKSCRESMEQSSSRPLRAWVQFFSQLTLLRIISPQSMLQFLQNLSQALDELGASLGRVIKASSCITEGLVRAGSVLFHHNSEAVLSLVESVISALPSSDGMPITSPFMMFHAPINHNLATVEVTAQLTSVLRQLVDSNFQISPELYPSLKEPLEMTATSGFPFFPLESVLLPPEQIDLSSTGPSGDRTVEAALEFPQCLISLFDDEVTPPLSSPHGYAIRNMIMDIADIYEINRKECAKILIGIPLWLLDHVFRSKSDPEFQAQEGSKIQGGWQLESTIVETLLSGLLNLPTPTILPIYFFSLLSELCKLSPTTFGPAVGKCFRKLHLLIGEGLDVEIVRRYGDWFATHMSNFGFQWVWKEWLPDLELPERHPKRLFLRRVLDLEIRLAYYDRVVRSVPEPFRSPEAGILPDQTPGPDYSYGDPNHPHNVIAQEILKWLQGRTDPLEVIAGIEKQKERLVDNGESDAGAMSILRSIIVQSLLDIGARSFSHFLNAIERYIKLMRHISTDPESRADILEAAGRFWKKNPQMMLITFDKLMQYQFADPSDLVGWAFRSQKGCLNTWGWELVRGALDKANGRVLVAQKKVQSLRREQDDAVATQKAQETADIDMDNNFQAEPKTPHSAALASALTASTTLIGEQLLTLTRIVENFVMFLSRTDSIISERSWENRGTWSSSDWEAYETWGWYRHFCRAYAVNIAMHWKQVQPAFITTLGENRGPAATLLREYWQIAGGP